MSFVKSIAEITPKLPITRVTNHSSMLMNHNSRWMFWKVNNYSNEWDKYWCVPVCSTHIAGVALPATDLASLVTMSLLQFTHWFVLFLKRHWFSWIRLVAATILICISPTGIVDVSRGWLCCHSKSSIQPLIVTCGLLISKWLCCYWSHYSAAGL